MIQSDEINTTNDFKERAVIKGTMGSFVLVNVFAVSLGIIILFLIYRLDSHYGSGFLIVGSIILAVWMAADAIIWRVRGVHELEVAAGGIRVVRGIRKNESFHPFSEISAVDFRNKSSRRILNIMLESKPVRVPGVVTLFQGRRIYLTSDAYNDQEFDLLAGVLEQYCSRKNIEFKKDG